MKYLEGFNEVKRTEVPVVTESVDKLLVELEQIADEIQQLQQLNKDLAVTVKTLVPKVEVKETIPSYEVAEMINKQHSDVLKMLEGTPRIIGIIPTLTKSNFTLSDYFIASTYKDASGKQNKCYECTKMGCEMLANKMTGEKGILFTARYVAKFNEMEKQIKQGDIPSIMMDDKFKALDKYKAELIQHDIEKNELKIQALSEEYEKVQVQMKDSKLTHSNKTYTTTEIAKELGFRSATALNKDLADRGIQHRVNGTWVLKANYSTQGYVETKQAFKHDTVIYYTKWTELGRQFLIDLYTELKLK